MTLNELHAQLNTLIAEGHGEKPIYAQQVERGGITYATDILMAVAGDPADGDLIWLIPGKKNPPAWMGGN